MKIKKILLLIMFLMPYASFLYSQDDEIDSLQFEPRTTLKQKKVYFAVGVGFTGTFLFTKFDDLNIKAKKSGLDDLKSPVFLPGLHIIAALPILPNTRVGFLSMGGSKLSEKSIIVSGVNVTRDLEYNVQINGFGFDYNIGILSNLVIIPGINIGWGNIKVESSQAQNQPIDWNNNAIVSDPLNFINRAEANFTFVQPNLYIEYAAFPFLMLRANVGYNYSFSFSGNLNWIYDRTATLNNMPKGINANGLTAQFGIFLGLFNYYSSAN